MRQMDSEKRAENADRCCVLEKCDHLSALECKRSGREGCNFTFRCAIRTSVEIPHHLLMLAFKRKNKINTEQRGLARGKQHVADTREQEPRPKLDPSQGGVQTI